MLTVTDYLKRADECDALVKTARTPNEVEALRQMAKLWRELAEDRTREIRRSPPPKEPLSPCAK
jgi:hypothetical protein